MFPFDNSKQIAKVSTTTPTPPVTITLLNLLHHPPPPTFTSHPNSPQHSTLPLQIATRPANPIFHARTKYVEVDYHFVCDRVAKKEIQIRFVSSRDQLADVFTKPLPVASFTSFRFKLRVDPPPSA